MPLQASVFQDVFPSPASTLSGGNITLNNPSQVNNTSSNTLVTTTLNNNGGTCDGLTCTKSNTSVSAYAFTPDVGNGTVGVTSGDIYTSSQSFNDITLNKGESVTFKGDLIIKAQYGITSGGTINIEGDVILHTTTLTQNTDATINIISGSLMIIASGDVLFNTASNITPTALLCFSKSTIKFNTGVQLTGLFYADTQVIVNNDVVITGAVTSKELTLNANAIINYGLSIGADSTGSIENIAEYRFDEFGAGEWKKDYSSNSNDLGGTPHTVNTDGKDYMCNAMQNSSWDLYVPHIQEYEVSEGTISLFLYDHHNVWDSARLLSKGCLVLKVERNNGDLTQGTVTVDFSGNRIRTGETYFTTLNVLGNDLDTQWTHVVFTFGSKGMKLYINGVLKGTHSYTGGLVGNTTDINFPGISGYFDEFYMFEGQMDDSDVTTLYQNSINNKNWDGSDRVCGAVQTQICGTEPLDIIIMNDQSGSVDTQEFEDSKTFVTKLANSISNWGASGVNMRYIGWADQSQGYHDQGFKTSAVDLINSLPASQVPAGQTDYNEAIENIGLQAIQEGRPNAQKVVVVITDSHEDHDFDDDAADNEIIASQRLKDNGATLVFIAVDGASRNTNILNSLKSAASLDNAGDPFVFSSNNFTDWHVQSFIDNLLNGSSAICEPPEDKQFSCSENAYVFYSDTFTSPTQVNEIDLLSATNNPLSPDIHPNNINAIGYNVVDNMIWGYDIVKHKVVKVDKDLKVASFDVAGLPEYSFHLGDVSPEGILYLASTQLFSIDGVESDGLLRLYRVDVNASSPTYLQKLSEVTLSDQSLRGADFAFNPVDKQLYMVEYDGHIYRIDPLSGTATDVGDTGLLSSSYSNDPYTPRSISVVPGFFSSVVDSHVQMFDVHGYFYFYAAKNRKFYRVNLTDPNNPNTNAVEFLGMSLPSNGDGARCANAGMGNSPVLTIDNVVGSEGESGTKDFIFTVSMDTPSTSDVSFWYKVVDGDGTNYDAATFADDDMQSGNAELTIPAGAVSTTVTVKVIGDKKVENREEFFVDIYDPTNAVITDMRGFGVILNDDLNIEIKAVDKTSTFNLNAPISTQIVNKDFELTVMAYNHTTGNVVSDMNITQIKQDTNLLWSGLITTNTEGMVDVPLKIARALKEANLTIYGDYNRTSYDSSTSDLFAVRPDRFKITLPNDSPKAGASFPLVIEALDADNNQTQNYNELVNTSFRVDFDANTTNACVSGTIDLSAIQFTNGRAEQNVNYSEVGNIDFNISEISGFEFAKVDTLHSGANGLTIVPDKSLKLNFIADRLVVSDWNVSSAGTHLYYADRNSILDMGLRLNAEIKALNALDDVVVNYDDGCRAKDANLEITYNNWADTSGNNTLLWVDLNNTSNVIASGVVSGVQTGVAFPVGINKRQFLNGKARVELMINFDRAVNLAKNPLEFDVKKVGVYSADTILHENEPLNTSAIHFYYGRLHIPDHSMAGDTINANADYEIFCEKSGGCNVSKFGLAEGQEGQDSINWYITSDSFAGAITNEQSRSADILNANSFGMTLRAFNIPTKDRVMYQTLPYLTFNRFNANATQHSFIVNFLSDGVEWSGEGSTGQTLNEDASTQQYQKMDW